MRCVPLSLVGVVGSKLEPVWMGLGFDPLRSSCQQAA